MNTKLTCAFTGHRPSSYSFGYNERYRDCVELKAMMNKQIHALAENGVRTFLSGMALGADMWGAELVLSAKEKYPDLRFVAVLPCETQADRWSAALRERYFHILARCDETVCISKHYTRDCMLRRNRWLIDHSDYVLAVYNGSQQGGTAYTVQYAREQHRTVIVIDPNKLMR